MRSIQVQGLPPRQAEVLELACKGKGEKDTARIMGISLSTVKSHRSSILFKLESQNIGQAISEGFQRGMLRFMCLTLLVGACTTVLPMPAEAGEREEPIMRRLRSQRTGRGIRRIRRLRDDLSTINPSDKAVIEHFGLEPVLIWDGELYVVYR